MENLGYILGLAALVLFFTLSGRVSKLERLLAENGIGNESRESLKEILSRHIGSYAKLEFEKGAGDNEVERKRCLIQDIDEEWILIEAEVKKQQKLQKLLRIGSIKSVQILAE